MPLELQKPDEPSQDEQELPLTLIDIAEFHAELEAYIDKRVAELRVRYTGLPASTIRATLVKGECLCRASMRLLKEDLR